MDGNDNTLEPLFTVFIKRGKKVAKGVPTKILVPYIEGKKLLGSDEISGDGKQWVRLDQHPQLNKFFKHATRDARSDAPPLFTKMDGLQSVSDPLSTLETGSSSRKSSPTTRLESELARLADMLEDLDK